MIRPRTLWRQLVTAALSKPPEEAERSLRVFDQPLSDNGKWQR